MAALPRITCTPAGISPAAIDALLDAVAEEGLELHSLMIGRGQAVVAEGWWAPYRADRVHLLYSLSKTFSATLLGTLVDEGRVELDRPVVEYLPQLRDVPPRYQRMTVRNCLNMASGHSEEAFVRPLPITDWAGENDPLLDFLFTLEPDQEPGSVFAYNQINTYVLGAVMRQVLGHSVMQGLRERVLDPLGIDEFYSQTTPRGDEFCFTGFYATTEAVLRLAMLYLAGGDFQGRRIVSENWVEMAQQPSGLPNPTGEGEWALGYGFQLWRSKYGYRGDGAFGQFALVVPEHELAVAITSEVEAMDRVLALVWEHLVDHPRSGGDERALRERLSQLAIPTPVGDQPPGVPQDWHRVGGDVEVPWDAIVAVSGEECTTLRLVGLEQELRVGHGQWLDTDLVLGDRLCPVSAAGAWANGAFTAQLRVVTTPHTMLFDARDGGYDLRWKMLPLGTCRLADLAVAPRE